MSLFDPQQRKENPRLRSAMALFRLAQAIKKMSQMESDPVGLSPVQVQTLLFVYHTRRDVASVGNLAKSIGTTHATAVGIVNGLLAKGLVQKQAKQEDRRITLLQLTESGRDVVAKIEDWGKTLQSAMDHLPDEVLDSFEIGLGAIVSSLQKAGHLVVAEPCHGCVHFRPNVAGSDQPHYCQAIKRYLSFAESQKECPEHAPSCDLGQEKRGGSVER
ncbi:MarR family winged helix-turn-helix transcriptional regulator [Brevibacillus humidisoli]|uniref:MarR family winged helix-turn-helix transcriptional regulator n=1 Tax=Brevibacillus humidisoli TaxID=2895522 RepID=UPI001E4B6D51|nr:MarR family winged helix-turn-helix transcriptional regulator [Brevibacillus humidisoli]UFJ41446.1 MarR family winged helix-turn-helix transcriptional regulator [Brevibacillus humidisoli]